MAGRGANDVGVFRTDPAGGATHDSALIRSLITGISVFRVACLAWLGAVLIATRRDVGNASAAVVVVGVTAVVTAVLVYRFRRRGAPGVLTTPTLIVEVATGALLGAADGIVYDGDHPLSLGSAWPLAGVFSAGIAWGTGGGALAGVAVGVGRLVGDLVEPGTEWSFDLVLGRTSTVFLFTLAGAMAGFAARRLLDAEAEIAMGRARAQVARTLHDGVLQTLAVVQRRSGDGDLVSLARDQERELREFLFGSGEAAGGGELGAVLRRVAARCEHRDGVPVTVVVAEDMTLPGAVGQALAGAVGEAVTNAAKHGTPTRVTVYAEPTDDGGAGTSWVFCSVKDDGAGFDPASVTAGVGLTHSIGDRIAEVGGRVEIAGNPGHGAEIRLWVPTGR